MEVELIYLLEEVLLEEVAKSEEVFLVLTVKVVHRLVDLIVQNLEELLVAFEVHAVAGGQHKQALNSRKGEIAQIGLEGGAVQLTVVFEVVSEKRAHHLFEHEVFKVVQGFQ